MYKKDVLKLIELLKNEYPMGDTSCLNFEKPHELLFSVRLAAQCTDERVNKITPALFERYPELSDYANAEQAEVETLIHSCGFFRVKARDIIECSRVLLSRFDGKIPDNMDDLLSLPGVGRKTANLILGDLFNKPGAVVVDTHCIRLSGRIGLVPEGMKNPEKIEHELRAQLPPEESNNFCHRLVLHGRAVCRAQSPRCEICKINGLCSYYKGK